MLLKSALRSGCVCNERGLPSQRKFVLPSPMKQNKPSNPRALVGEQRFTESAVPGTYWSQSAHGAEAEAVNIEFTTNDRLLEVQAQAGQNLLRSAEACGAIKPNLDFCFEGTCEHCVMEVEGGAMEVGTRADPGCGDFVRSCITPIPARKVVRVAIIGDEDAWADAVV